MDSQLRKFGPFWSKYRPAILKMLVEAAEKPQQYRLTVHELAAMDGKKNSRFEFNLHVSGRKATNNIKNSAIAQDLLDMLQLSPKGSELISTHDYEIVLDKNFILHVSQVDAQPK